MNKLSMFISKGLALFKESLSFNIASILTLVTILFIYTTFIIIGNSTDNFLKSFTKVQTFRVYLTTDVKSEIDNVVKILQTTEGVDSAKYFSSEDAYNYLKENTANINYLEKIPSDFFPQFVEVTLKNSHKEMKHVRDIQTKIAGTPGVDVSSFGEDWISNFKSIRSAVKFFMFILTILLTLAVSFIIFNTIRLNLYRYKEDIQIYNLVGATKYFIEAPYLVASFIEIIISLMVSSVFAHLILAVLNYKLLKPVNLDIILMPGLWYYVKVFVFMTLISLFSCKLSVNLFLKQVKSINES